MSLAALIADTPCQFEIVDGDAQLFSEHAGKREIEDLARPPDLGPGSRNPKMEAFAARAVRHAFGRCNREGVSADRLRDVAMARGREIDSQRQRRFSAQPLGRRIDRLGPSRDSSGGYFPPKQLQSRITHLSPRAPCITQQLLQALSLPTLPLHAAVQSGCPYSRSLPRAASSRLPEPTDS